jgi:hypothetical protein
MHLLSLAIVHYRLLLSSIYNHNRYHKVITICPVSSPAYFQMFLVLLDFLFVPTKKYLAHNKGWLFSLLYAYFKRISSRSHHHGSMATFANVQ